jgi:hypothetical protein
MLKTHRLLLNCDNHAQKDRCSGITNIVGRLVRRILAVTLMVPRQNLNKAKEEMEFT